MVDLEIEKYHCINHRDRRCGRKMAVRMEDIGKRLGSAVRSALDTGPVILGYIYSSCIEPCTGEFKWSSAPCTSPGHQRHQVNSPRGPLFPFLPRLAAGLRRSTIDHIERLRVGRMY